MTRIVLSKGHSDHGETSRSGYPNQHSKPMNKTHQTLLAAAVACAVALGAITHAKTPNPVQRPISWKGVATIQADLAKAEFADGFLVVPWEIVNESGQATHCGRYTSHGGGTMMMDLSGNVLSLTGAGRLVAANGDVIYWHETQQGSELPVIYFNGGTGRFQNAVGEAVAQMVMLSENLETGTITAAVSGAGWISY
jgi:ligand-binding SRPBCC domain-containing protein